MARALARAEVQEQAPVQARESALERAVREQEPAAAAPEVVAQELDELAQGAVGAQAVAAAAREEEAEPRVLVPGLGLARGQVLALARGWARVPGRALAQGLERDLEWESAQEQALALVQQPPSPPAPVPPRAAGQAHPLPGCPGLAIAACF